MVTALTAGMWALCAGARAGEPGESPGRMYTSTERLLPARLAAARADVERHQASRVAMEALPGLIDFRTAIHLHAEDSDHTGGTLPELLADAKRGNVKIVMLSDHYRPPRDFMEGWRGLRDGVLFIPGVEAKGFLLYPDASIMDVMEAPTDELIARATAGSGLIFLSHVEERVEHPTDGLTGMEIYNRHADAKDDGEVFLAIAAMLGDPGTLAALKESVERYHDEFLACQLDYPSLYLGKWDREMQERRLVGVGAIDCHHNQVVVMKKVDDRTVRIGTILDADEDMQALTADMLPGIAEVVKGYEPGAEIARLDLDTYYHSFRTMSTHILAPELTEPAVRATLRAGHAYVSHDWMCDPTGFRFTARGADDVLCVMGDERPYEAGMRLVAEFPAACTIRLLKNGEEAGESEGRKLEHAADGPGAYRVEAWLRVDGEDRPWIYSNPIYLR